MRPFFMLPLMMTSQPCRAAVLALALGLAAGAAGAADDAPPLWRLRLQADRHSDMLSLSDMNAQHHERATPRDGHNVAYLEDEVRLSREHGGWTWSVLARNSAVLSMNRDAVEVVRQVESRQSPAADRQWQPRARVQGFSGFGLEAERGMALGGGWHARAGVQGLALTRLLQRTVSGPARFDAALSSWHFDLRSDEVNDRRSFPFQRSAPAQGAGLLLGGELGWSGDRLAVALAMRDAGWLRWNDVPRQDAVLASDVSEVDADGFLLYRPLVQGQNRQGAYTTVWRPRWTLRGSWQATPQLAATASLRTLPGVGVLPAFSLQHHRGGVDYALGWQFHERRATLSAAWDGWQLVAGTDRLRDAHSRLLGLGYARTF